MANKRFSDLAAAAALTGTEVVPCIQSGSDVRTTAQAIANLATASTGAMPTVKMAPFSATGDGTTADQAAFTACATAHVHFRVPPGTYRIAANTSISSGMALDAGAVFSIDTGVTLTIAGPLAAAGRVPHFAGAGTVVLSPGSVDSVCAEWFGLSTAGTEADNTAALQRAWAAAYGTGLTVGRGAFPLADTELLVFALAGTSQLPSFFRGCGVDGNGGGGGVSVNVGTSFFGSSARIHFNNSTASNSDAKLIVSGFHVVGPNDDTAGVGGIKVTKTSNIVIEHTQVTGSRGHGYEMVRCYGAVVRNNTALACRTWGLLWDKQANQSASVDNKLIGNGKIYTAACGNLCFAGGSGFESLGHLALNNDVSYAGANAVLYRKTNPSPSARSITITDIVVSGATATVTTATAHGRTTGDLIVVFGVTSDARLNTIYTPAITVTGATTFTWTVVAQPNQAGTAAAGTYTDATMVIAPAAHGAVYSDLRGCTFTHYAEDCMGLSAYIGANVLACELRGGYNQGVNSSSGGNGAMLVDDATGLRIGGLNMTGANASLQIAATDRKHGIDVASSVTAESGAFISQPTIRLIDGQYSSTAAPGSGTWAQGDWVANRGAAAGQPQGWYCSAAPATFVAIDAASGGGGLPSQTSHAGKYLTTNGTTASWALPTSLSSLSANLGSITAGSINTTGTLQASSGTFGSATVSGTVGITGMLTGGAAQFSGGLYATNAAAGIGLTVDAPASGGTGIRVANAASSGSGLTIDASLGGTALYIIGGARWDQTPATGSGTASTAFLSTKPGASTNGQWLTLNVNGASGRIPWWPD